MRLASAIKYDLCLQFRHGFYYAYLIVCIAYIVIVRVLPPDIRRYALVVTLLTDPSILGFTLVSFTNTINGYLLSSPIYYILAVLPLLDFFGIYQSPLFYIIPTQSSLTLINGAFSAEPFAELVLSVVFLLGFNFLGYHWAKRCFNEYIILRTGATA